MLETIEKITVSITILYATISAIDIVIDILKAYLS